MGKTDKTLKEFELDAKGAKAILDRLNRAYYGMTFDEIIRRLARCDEAREEAEKCAREH